MLRLEIYAIALAVLAAVTGAAYFKGRHDEGKKNDTEQLAATAAELQKIVDRAHELVATDETSRTKAQAFIDRTTQGFSHVAMQFSKLPNVVVDAGGCNRFADAFRLRWNAQEAVPAREAARASGPRGTLPAAPGAATGGVSVPGTGSPGR